MIKGDTQTYGTFATVIGLLAWLYLGARIVVYAAELNVVLTRRLWPRSIIDPPEPADRRARAALAKMEARDSRETIDVSPFIRRGEKRSTFEEYPAYRVAPEPAPGERAEQADPVIARTGLGDLTAEQLLNAIRGRLDSVGGDPSARSQAREWIDHNEEIITHADRDVERGDAAAVLLRALADALGVRRGSSGAATAASGRPEQN